MFPDNGGIASAYRHCNFLLSSIISGKADLASTPGLSLLSNGLEAGQSRSGASPVQHVLHRLIRETFTWRNHQQQAKKPSIQPWSKGIRKMHRRKAATGLFLWELTRETAGSHKRPGCPTDLSPRPQTNGIIGEVPTVCSGNFSQRRHEDSRGHDE